MMTSLLTETDVPLDAISKLAGHASILPCLQFVMKNVETAEELETNIVMTEIL